jgi:hypothetical protein
MKSGQADDMAARFRNRALFPIHNLPVQPGCWSVIPPGTVFSPEKGGDHIVASMEHSAPVISA